MQAQFLCNASFTSAANPSGSYTFTATGANSAAAAYSWTIYGGGSTQSGTVNPFTTNILTPGTYTVMLTVSDPANNCVDSSWQTIVINNTIPCTGMPNAGNALASNNNPLQGTLVTYSLIGASSGTGITYQWQRAISSTATFYSVGSAGTNSTFAENCYSDYCYRCIITCSNSGLSDTSAIVCTTPVIGNPSCTASISYTMSANGVVIFNSNSTGVNNGTTYTWTYMNSVFGNTSNATYQFPSNGIYNICLHIGDTIGNCNDDTCLNVTITNVGSSTCNAAFTINSNPSSLYTFTSTGSAAASTIYSWTITGTGFTQSGTGSTYSMTLPNNGNYLVTLYIVDTLTNCSDSTSQVINFLAPCQAGFYIYPDSTIAHMYWGINTSTGTNLSYTWTWGDGTSSTGQYPSHTYASAGSYTICLTVISNSSNCIDSFCFAATINKTDGMVTLNFANPLSIGSVKNETATIYPNPVTSDFMIKGNDNEKMIVEFYTINGSQVKSISTKTNQAIDISTLAKSIYFLKIFNQDGKSHFAKLIKQ
jgi:PKD repeat protein